MKTPSDIKQQAWVRLIRVQRGLLEQVEQKIKSAGMPPLIWYDVLLELERSEKGLRQFELGENMLLSKHNLSRLLDRMEKKKLIKRAACPEDGRGSITRITAAGRQLRKSMWPQYAKAMDEVFASRLTDSQAREFSNTLEKLLD